MKSSAMLRTEVDAVRAVLRENPTSVLGAAEPDDRMLNPHRFRSEVPVLLGSGAFAEQAVTIELGRVPADEQELRVPISWEPTGHEKLVPRFSGELIVEPSESSGQPGVLIVIEGTYVVPMGALGRVGDALGGHRVAEASVAEFVARFVQRIGDEVNSRRRTPRLGPTPYNEDLRPRR